MKIITDMKCNYIIALLLLLLSCYHSNAATSKSINEETKTFEKQFTVSESSHIDLRNRRGNINIVYREGSQAEIKVNVTVRGTDPLEMQKVFNQFELDVRENGNMITAKSNDNINCWTRMNTFFRKSNTIKFEDKSTAIDIEEIDVNMVLFLPKISKLDVDNKYHDILFTDLKCDFEVSLYSGKLKGNDITGDLELQIKYGTVKIGSFKEGDIDIYDSKFSSKNSEKVRFKSKYSNITCDDFESLTLFSYDDEIILGSIKGEFVLEAKYTNLRMQSFGTADIDGHDTDVKGRNGSVLKLNSKYGSFDFEELNEATLKLHDDNFEVESLTGLTIKNSKYSEIYIDQFSGSMNILSSHDDDIYVLNPVSELASIDADLKYSTFKFPIRSNTGFFLEADTKYGTLDIGRDFDHEHTNRDKSSSVLNINGKATGTKKGSASINIKAYDSKVDLSQ